MNTMVRTNKLKIGSAIAAAAMVALLGTTSASAQTPYAGASFAAGVPVGEFRDTLDKQSFGVDLDLGFQLAELPIAIGLQGSFMTYGNEERSEPWSNTIPDVKLDVETNNNIALAHAYVRLIPETGVIRPYFDAKAGVTYLFTSTSVKSRGFSENSEIASSTNFDDLVFSYGAGIGAQIQLWKNDSVEAGDASEVMLDIRGGYLSGGDAEYLTRGSIVRGENGKITYEPKHSKTEMIDARVGVQVRF